MNSGAQSCVNLTTANTPSTSVQCHKPIKGQSKDLRKSSVVTINEFLKNGGTLPSVLQVDDSHPSVGTSSDDCDLRPAINMTANPRIRDTRKVLIQKKKLEAKSQTTPTKNSSSSINVNDIQKKMEQLSCKLSNVQDILLNHMAVEAPHFGTAEKVPDGYSAEEYTYLILEMNGNVSVQPYDPDEFAEKDHSCDTSKLPDSRKGSDKIVNHKNSPDRSAVLLAIQEELMKWRDEKRNAEGRCTPTKYCTSHSP